MSDEGFGCGRLVERIWMFLLANVEACHLPIGETHEVLLFWFVRGLRNLVLVGLKPGGFFFLALPLGCSWASSASRAANASILLMVLMLMNGERGSRQCYPLVGRREIVMYGGLVVVAVYKCAASDIGR